MIIMYYHLPPSLPHPQKRPTEKLQQYMRKQHWPLSHDLMPLSIIGEAVAGDHSWTRTQVVLEHHTAADNLQGEIVILQSHTGL